MNRGKLGSIKLLNNESSVTYFACAFKINSIIYQKFKVGTLTTDQ